MASDRMGAVTERNAREASAALTGTAAFCSMATLPARALADANVIFSVPPASRSARCFADRNYARAAPTPPDPAAAASPGWPLPAGLRTASQGAAAGPGDGHGGRLGGEVGGMGRALEGLGCGLN